ncbi:MAG: beta-lactamase family protein [Leptospirales bacterium]|nr:beta-lactamase family protein [Leptospirales bacterium]
MMSFRGSAFSARLALVISIMLGVGELGAVPAVWDLSALDSFAPAVMRKREIGGLQVCISDRTRSECFVYGVRDTDRNPVTVQTYFMAAGLMQPITALSALDVAQKSGKRLSDVVFESNGAQVTLEQLLTQTSGFAVARASFVAGSKLPDIVPLIESTPGKAYLATAGNYAVLSQRIVDWGGQDFTKAVSNHARASGLELVAKQEGYFLFSPGTSVEERAQGVAAPGSKVFMIELPETAVPGWDGLWTTAKGYATYLRSISSLRGKELFKPLFQYHPDLGGSVPGFHLMKDRCGFQVLRVEGQRGGFFSFATLFEDGRSIVVLGNAPHPEAGRELYQFIRQFVWKETCEVQTTLSPDDGLEGFYRARQRLPSGLGWLGFLQDIKIQKGEQGLELLGMFEGKSAVHWIPISQDLYVARGSAAMDGWTIRVERNADGTPSGFASDLASYKKIPAILSVRAMPVLLAFALFIMLAALLVFLSLKKKRSQNG